MDTQKMNAAGIVIRAQMLRTEHATNSAAEENAHLIALLLKKRSELECAISLGEPEVGRAYQALGRTLSSMRSLAIMHEGLHVIADEGDGGSDFGPHKKVPNEPGGLLQVA